MPLPHVFLPAPPLTAPAEKGRNMLELLLAKLGIPLEEAQRSFAGEGCECRWWQGLGAGDKELRRARCSCPMLPPAAGVQACPCRRSPPALSTVGTALPCR